jgi:hypothetical protein
LREESETPDTFCMDFGIALAPAADAWKTVQRAEASASRMRGSTTFTGTRAELIERVRTLRDAGYQQLAVQLVRGHEDAMDDCMEVFSRV